MPNPPTALPFPQPLDPRDVVDYYVFLRQGEPDKKPYPLLLVGEGVASYSLVLSSEAVAVGLRIVTDAGYAPVLNGNRLKVNLTIDSATRGMAAFNDAGVVVGVQIRFATNAEPARTKNRTFLVRISNQ